MKQLLTLLIVSTLGHVPSWGQTAKEEITRTLSFAQGGEDNVLVLKNISGHVRVVGYQGDEVRLTARKKIRADNREDLARAQEEVQLVAETEGNVAWVYLEAPFIRTERQGDDLRYQVNRHDDDYHFRFDFTVEVPTQTNLRVSTVNGDVSVEDVAARQIDVNNVNGPIRCTDISGTTHAQTVNGEMDITYAEAPSAREQLPDDQRGDQRTLSERPVGGRAVQEYARRLIHRLPRRYLPTGPGTNRSEPVRPENNVPD